MVGAKNNEICEIRLDIFKTRTTENMKTFIYNHINPLNKIITNGWSSYHFLDDVNSPYAHEEYSHSPNGNFGLGINSTSHIEGLWGTLKQKIKSIYNSIPSTNFILYLREAEIRYILSKLNSGKKEKYIMDLLEYLYNTCDYKFYDIKILYDNNDYNY